LKFEVRMHDVILEAKGIQKAFGGVMAVAGVDLTIQRGEVFALIGPNGAGKTTMFNLLSGTHPLDRGQIVRTLGTNDNIVIVAVTVRIPAHGDHRFRRIAITDSD